MKTKQAFNPYMPSWEYVPDAEPHIVDGRVYVYGSHDLFDGLNFCLGDYVCWSAPVDDLGNWTYHGCIYKREQDPAAPKIRLTNGLAWVRRKPCTSVWRARAVPLTSYPLI